VAVATATAGLLLVTDTGVSADAGDERTVTRTVACFPLVVTI
jgi:hypothetical protein